MAAEAARSWQDVLAQQAEEGSAPLRELLSAGLYLLRTELGLDLGLEPHSYPAWVILLGTAAVGLLLLLLLGLGWAAACAGARQRRRSPPRRREEASTPVPVPAPEDGALLKNLKSEDSRKKNRKRLTEKPKPNGRTVLEVPEEEVVTTPRREAVKQQHQHQHQHQQHHQQHHQQQQHQNQHHQQQQQQQQQQLDAEKKNEKLKKNKKKSKSEVKAVQNSTRHDGKEVDEGT